MAHNSKLILAKGIKMDKNYVNVLSYSEEQILQLVSDTNHKIYEASNYSFIREQRGTISVAVPYGTSLQANYLAFQNYDYSNKWFFAWIDSVEFVNENTSKIHYTVDAWSTWFSYWSKKSCWVNREHVNDDTIGLHTVDEGLETGEFICNEHYKDSTMDSYANDLCYVMASTSTPLSGEAKDTVAPSGKYNGIYTGLSYYEYEADSAIDSILEIFADSGKTDAINGIFMAPKWLAPYGTLRAVTHSDSPASFNINVSKQTTLNGYTPKNNKMKCYPFNYLLVSNNIGQNSIMHYEKFSDSDNATFNVKGVLNPGCSINLTPTNYNGSASSDNDAIQLGKFPICNFQNDMYTNWLTQNSINVLGMDITTDEMNIANAGLNALSNVAEGSVMGSLSGAQSVLNSLIAQKQHNMISPTVKGQLNSADVNVASGNNTFHFYKMTVKAEFAKICDDYLTRYGYKINRIKEPNITGRTTWNYVEIGSNSEIGYGDVPSTYMETINNACRKGVTIWHNHANVGDFSLNNTIA